MPLPKCAPSRFALIALLCLSLPACTTLGGLRWKPRVESCQQDRVPIPDWPAEAIDADETAAIPYALELLGVIRDDRMAERRERECVREL